MNSQRADERYEVGFSDFPRSLYFGLEILRLVYKEVFY
jgi:hypothetical protein